MTRLLRVLVAVCMVSVVRCEPKEAPKFRTAPVNTTAVEHTDVKLKCRIVAHPKPKVTWSFNGVAIKNSTGFIIKKNRGTLLMSKVETSQEGWYHIQAGNKWGVVTGTVYLSVLVPAEITDGPKNMTVDWGSEVVVNCSVRGKPRPTVSWEKNGRPLIDDETGKIYSRQQLSVNATESATYQCKAQNIVQGQHHQTASQLATITYTESSRPMGHCSMKLNQTKSLCEPYMRTYSPVYINGTHDNQIERNEQRLATLFQHMDTMISAECEATIKSLVCHMIYPPCEENQPKFLCRESCVDVKDNYCSGDWTKLSSRLSLHDHLKPLQCESLPTHHCAQLQDRHLSLETCYTNKGERYAGSVNVTKTGRECMPWKRYPHNYCRNEEGSKSAPWCYTNKEHDWDYCPVHKCHPGYSPSSLFSKSQDNGRKMTVTLLVITSVASVVFLTLVASIIYFAKKLWTKYRRHSNYLTPVQMKNRQSISINSDKLTKNMFYQQQPYCSAASPRARLDDLEYPRNNIVHLEDLCKGADTQVFKAKGSFFTRGHFKETQLAVKILSENATNISQDRLISEAYLMCDLDHPNIVKLLGVCMNEPPICLIYEYMSQGQLTEFLRQNSPQYFKVTDDCKDTGHVRQLNVVEQLDIAIQIASAMLYLSSKGFVHRDVATRNCLVADHLIVKLSHSASMLPPMDESRSGQALELQSETIRWMAPEVIFSNKFTWSSDVWSFGVLLWEIFSFAMEPYYEQPGEEDVIEYLKAGCVLQNPTNANQAIYDVMKQCWNYQANERPKFSTIYHQLSSLRHQYNENKYTTMNQEAKQTNKLEIDAGNLA